MVYFCCHPVCKGCNTKLPFFFLTKSYTSTKKKGILNYLKKAIDTD